MHDRELEFRRLRLDQIRADVAHDGDYLTNRAELHRRREEGRSVMQDGVATFLQNRDLGALIDCLGSVLDGPAGIALWPGLNTSVVAFVQDLRDLTNDEDQLTGLVAEVLQLPDDDGSGAIDQLLTHVQVVRKNAHPSQRDGVSFLSLCWWLQQASNWPATWAPVEDGMRLLGWLADDQPLADRYRSYRSTFLALGQQQEVEDSLSWFSTSNWSGLDEAIGGRLDWAFEIYKSRLGDTYPDDLEQVAETNIAAVLAELRRLGDVALHRTATAVGRNLTRQVSSKLWDSKSGAVRADGWVKWKLPLTGDSGFKQSPSIWLTASRGGVLVGFHPGRRERGWVESVRQRLLAAAPPELEVIRVSGLWENGVPKSSGEGEFVVGHWFPGNKMLGTINLLDQIEQIAVACQPVFDLTLRLAVADPDPDPDPDPVPDPDDPLNEWVSRFHSERGDRNEGDDAHREARTSMEDALAEDALDELEMTTLARICNSSRYGSTGFTNPVRAALAGAGPAEAARVRAMIRHLLWDDGDPADRLERCLNNEDLGVPGFGEAPLLKLLAIAHPDRFLPLFRLKGERGKLDLIAALELDEPPSHGSRGARHVEANDVLRKRLDPFFDKDPWAQAEFAVWYRRAIDDSDGGENGLDSRLDDVVDRCLMEGRAWLDEVVAMLTEKRQIVLYGPPGTGKTFIAQALAEALAPDADLRRLVQFHPSTSYEDFFEGYRPSADASGNLSYSLQQGPFAELADHAAGDSRTHVLIIDELNRANVPKVLGELLFLLEYRDRSVVPLYRPEGFQLPENLWIIATMNTADRSIASLDAALRRRFHFIPIFPHLPPVDGLLDRFLSGTGGDVQWGQLVTMVNEELCEKFGNNDLMIGPSYFMKSDLDEMRMDRIWRYDIEPFLEDQFFGDQATIERFRWPRVLHRHWSGRQTADGDPEPVQPADVPPGESPR